LRPPLNARAIATPLCGVLEGWRNVERRAMDAAFAKATEAKLIPVGREKPVMHDCRHTFGSMLIREGEDVYSVTAHRRSKSVSAPRRHDDSNDFSFRSRP
jgi:hypothetical protein